HDVTAQLMHDAVGDVLQRVPPHESAYTSHHHDENAQQRADDAGIGIASRDLIDGPPEPLGRGHSGDREDHIAQNADRKYRTVWFDIGQQPHVYGPALILANTHSNITRLTTAVGPRKQRRLLYHIP